VHIDARTLPDGSVIEGDLCIVGAGAAGISIALEWIGSSRTVLLLEGGGFAFEQKMQDLYRGTIAGLPYYPLDAARLHYFGGTTGHWAGFCSTLDPIDFEERPWVPDSGWPIERRELDPFYARAHGVLDLGPYEYDAAQWQRRNPAMMPLPLDAGVAWTKIWQFSPPTRFGAKYRDAITSAANVRLYTHANVCELRANEPATAIDDLRVRTLEGKEHRVRARQYVLACGTIQNARLLLASNARAAAGLGNAHDLVGRYFMEHLEMPSGQLLLTARRPPPMSMYSFEFGKTKARGELALSAESQRAHRLLNATVSLTPAALEAPPMSTFEQFPPDSMPSFRGVARADSAAPIIEPNETARRPAVAAAEPPRLFALLTRQEQAPNRDSRVTLAPERDAMGMPRVRLDWRLTPLDRRSFRGFYEVLGRDLGRRGIGRVRMHDWVLEPESAAWPKSLGGGWHHMGTTRMHPDARRGVVDASCRVHGIANLYVAGAAVYPTAGCANPTLTLVALSLRLSDHLKGALS
jgi:choline dehydrogenase-like flavoprotein